MGPQARFLGLLVAVAAIVVAILAIQHPWSRGGGTTVPAAALPTATSAAVGSTSAPAMPTPARPPPPPGAEEAPELEGLQAWINSQPLALGNLRGKVVLVDFWTYTCVNCLRTLPYIKQWQESYSDRGLVIVGVHSPEFQFEHDLGNVQRAVKDLGLKYAVALDNDFKTWDNFRNRYWPAKYLIDKDGYIRYRHFGEGSYAETEERIQQLLQEAGAQVSVGSKIDRQAGEVDSQVWDKLTIEMYLGYKRTAFYSYLGNPEGYQRDLAVTYHDYGMRNPNRFYLEGFWNVTEESAYHARVTQGYEDYLALKYTARSVNLVIKPKSEAGFRSLVTMDGQALTASNKGDDVVVDSDGKSYLVAREPRLYNVVKDQEMVTHDLKIYADSEAFSAYAFTFGP